MRIRWPTLPAPAERAPTCAHAHAPSSHKRKLQSESATLTCWNSEFVFKMKQKHPRNHLGEPEVRIKSRTEFSPSWPFEMLHSNKHAISWKCHIVFLITITEVIILIKSNKHQKKWQVPSFQALFTFPYSCLKSL